MMTIANKTWISYKILKSFENISITVEHLLSTSASGQIPIDVPSTSIVTTTDNYINMPQLYHRHQFKQQKLNYK